MAGVLAEEAKAQRERTPPCLVAPPMPHVVRVWPDNDAQHCPKWEQRKPTNKERKCLPKPN